MSRKKLYRSRTDRMLAGVIGGLADYLNMDSNFLRLITVIIALVTAVVPTLFVYGVAWLILPEDR